MKEIFHKISAILLAFVVLFSTMSVTVHEHYCGGEMVDSSMFIKAESCGMDMAMDVPAENCPEEVSVTCCEDVVKLIEGQTELKTQVSNLEFEQQLFVAAFIKTYINLFEGLETNIVPFKDYSPPLLFKDIQLLDEVFII